MFTNHDYRLFWVDASKLLTPGSLWITDGLVSMMHVFFLAPTLPRTFQAAGQSPSSLMRLSFWLGPHVVSPSPPAIMPFSCVQISLTEGRIYWAIQALPFSQGFKEREHMRPLFKRSRVRGRGAPAWDKDCFLLDEGGAEPCTMTHLFCFVSPSSIQIRVQIS